MAELGHDRRKELVARCDADVSALLEDAARAGLPLEQVVVVVADPDDALGAQVARACEALGEPVTGGDVYVFGFPIDLAREVLGSVDDDLPSRLDASPPAGTAQVLCFAAGGITSMWLGRR